MVTYFNILISIKMPVIVLYAIFNCSIIVFDDTCGPLKIYLFVNYFNLKIN